MVVVAKPVVANATIANAGDSELRSVRHGARLKDMSTGGSHRRESGDRQKAEEREWFEQRFRDQGGCRIQVSVHSFKTVL